MRRPALLSVRLCLTKFEQAQSKTNSGFRQAQPDLRQHAFDEPPLTPSTSLDQVQFCLG